MALSEEAQALASKYGLQESAQQQTQQSEPTDSQDLYSKYRGQVSSGGISQGAQDLAKKYGIKVPETSPNADVMKGNRSHAGPVDSVAIGAIQGFGEGPVLNSIRYLESKFPRVMGVLNEGGLDSVYGSGFSSETTTDQQRRDMISSHNAKWKSDLIQKYFNNEDVSNHPYLNMAGQFIGGLADPSILVAPEIKAATWVGRTAQVAKFGAKFGAAQAASEVLAKDGVPTSTDELSDAASKVATSAATGFIVGGLVHGAILEPFSKVSGMLKAKIRAGQEVTSEELSKAFSESPKGSESVSTNSAYARSSPYYTVEEMAPQTGGPTDFTKMAIDLNESLGLGKGAEAARHQAIIDNLSGDSTRSSWMINKDYEIATGTKSPKAYEDVKVNLGSDEAGKLREARLFRPQEEQGVYYTDAEDIQALDALSNTKMSATILSDSKTSVPLHSNVSEAALEAIKDGDVLITSETGKKLYAQPAEPGEGVPEFNSNATSNSEEFAGLQSKSLTMGQALIRPQTVWKSLGSVGEKVSSMFTNWNDRIRMSHGQWMRDWNNIKVKYDLTPDDTRLVRGLLNRSAQVDSQTPQRIINAAKDVRKMFNGRVTEYVNQGILTKAQGNELIQAAESVGYFPRVYDKAFLKSEEGQKAFFKAMSEVKYGNYESAKTAANSILGNKSITDMTNYITKDANGNWILTPDIYKRIWERSSAIGQAGLSSHLEKARKYPPELEKVLDRFMVVDVDKAMSAYSHDTATRLESAKIWGNNNENAAEVFKQMWDESPAIARSFREAFFKQQGDPRSWAVQTFMNAAQWQTKGSAFLRNLQLLKLTMSGITNSTQHPVNGALFLSAKTGINGAITPYQALKIYSQSIAKGWASKFGKKAFEEEANAFGAGIEHIHADFAGRISDLSKTGQKLDKVPYIGDIIKDPGKWLDLVRFNATEDINRTSSYHLGKQYILQLLKNKAKLDELAKVGRANPKQLAKIEAALKEVGIHPSKNITSATISDVENGSWLVAKAGDDMKTAIGLGAQRVSNIINFVNDADQMPHFYGSFTGKMLWQLKRFTYGQGAFANEYALKPLIKQGNPLPLMVYLTIGTGAGYIVNNVRNFLNADDKEKTLTRAMLDAQNNVASFGIIQDLLTSATYGQRGLSQFVMGPGPSQAISLGSSLAAVYNQAAYQNKWSLTPVAKEVVNQMSFPGKVWVKQQLTPEKEPIQFRMEAYKEGKGPFDSAIFGKKAKEQKAPFEDSFQ